MKVAVFGLGYVGTVTAAAFAELGNEVVGVDTNERKVETLARGDTPVLEPGLAELVAAGVAQGRLSATVDGESAAAGADVSLICVGTPSQANGSLDTTYVKRVAETIGRGFRGAERRRTVVLRSTCLPGTTETVVGAAVAAESGLEPGPGFGLVMNPEFLREGSSLADFRSPAKTVIGELDAASGDVLAELYRTVPGPVFRVPLRVAEMVKYADNSYHALKIAYANEIGVFCQSMGIDSHEVMDVFMADDKLNISRAYLTPGFAFGGSCLPKDLRAVVHAGRRMDLELPLLESVLPSNERHIQRTFDAVIASGRRKVALIGLSFKPGTDDLRESPLVALAERLLGKGLELSIYDPLVQRSALVGANLEYVREHLPHLSALMSDDLAEVVSGAEVCVVGARVSGLDEHLEGIGDRIVVDLVRLSDAETRRGEGGYLGAAW
ncbi:MAG TPA: UDP-glucose/GDP-mannose dehydrogenase family protein [Gaiellaceae bacterium]|nr:UDP-glucose/GDP-mannose dehydrogenase family protein [Gaiellaceae bacterium]